MISSVILPTNQGVIASSIRHDLSDRDLIIVEGRRITIPDVEKLHNCELRM